MAKLGFKGMPLSPGRPRVQLDEELLVELSGLGYGFKRIASEYTRRTGEYVSHMLVRDRLMDIKKRWVARVLEQQQAVYAAHLAEPVEGRPPPPL